MNHQENSYQYNDVNKEIQQFLSSRENKNREIAPHQEQQDILPLLESLNRTYSEINAALRTENSAALKDVILKSDVKMSLVCETLLETLRKTAEDKNNLIKENQLLEKQKRDYESKEFNNKILIDKLRNELEFKKASLDEMNRIIQDQKSIMNECKEESNKSKSESMFYKAKIEEIENLRSRANERMSVYERELEALGTVIQEKDSRIQTLMNEKREEENKNLNIKTRMTELEAILESMNKKMEVKDRNMTLCNSELSKVLCENKKMKSEYEKYKESSTYYEGLYNSLNAQNSYLNSQLNKMLKNTEYSKDIDSFIAKYKKKLKRARRKIKKLESEKSVLNEKVEDSVCNDTSEMLIKQIEDLNSKNEKYQTRIQKLEDEKKEIESKVKNLTVTETNTDFKERIKIILNKPEKKYPENTKDLKSEYSSRNTIPFRSSFVEPRSMPEGKYPPVSSFEPSHWKNRNDLVNSKAPTTTSSHFFNPSVVSNTRTFEDIPRYSEIDYRKKDYVSSNNQPDSTYLKLFNLENDYGHSNKSENPVGENLAGGFIQDSDISPVRLNMDYTERKNSYSESAIGVNQYPSQKNENILPNNDSIRLNNFGKYTNESSRKNEDFKDNESLESVKTYHTTSTLKEMMAKTDQLVKKFSDLEGKLEKFNEGETVDNLTDKLKTYNSYYSDWNAESNESDYI